MTMRYVKIVLQSGECRTAKRSIAHCRSKKWSSGWGPQGCSKSPSNFPIVRERVLRDARKLKKRLVGAPGFEPGGLLRPRQARLASGQPGDIWGTRKQQNGDAGKLLTDARETSYVILISLLTADR